MQNPYLLELTFYLRNAYPPFVTQINPDPVKDYVPVFISHKVTSSGFEEKLKFLKENNYRTITANELLSFIQGNYAPQGPTICLTFDDGHKTLYKIAFPLLKKYGFTAVSFIVPAFIGQPNWVTWQEIEEMHKSGIVDFQSHTLEHKKIPVGDKIVDSRMSDKPRYFGEGEWETKEEQSSAILFDLTQSKKILEERLNKPIRHLAYPWGIGSKLSQELSKKTGYLTNFWGPIYGIPYNRTGGDPYGLVRLKDDYILRLQGKGRKSLLNIFSYKLKRRKEAKTLGVDIYQ